METIPMLFDEMQKTFTISHKSIKIILNNFNKDKTKTLIIIKKCFILIMNAIDEIKFLPKKIMDTYERFIERTISYLFPKEKDETININIDKNIELTEELLKFFSEEFIRSSIHIQIFKSRILISIFHGIRPKNYLLKLSLKLLDKIYNISLFLVFQTNTLKRLGIILSSNFQFLQLPEFEKKHLVFNKEMLRIACNEENKESRKNAIKHLKLNEENIDDFLQRLRETDLELRLLNFEKLIKEKILLVNLNLDQIYKIIYDGINSREEKIKLKCLEYLKFNYLYFENNDEKLNYKIIRLKLINFVKIFQIEQILIRPFLYNFLQDFFMIIIDEIIDFEDLLLFLKKLLLEHLIINKKNDNFSLQMEEIFILKIILIKFYDNNDQENYKNNEINTLIEENFPNAINYLEIINYFLKKKNFVAFYECLQVLIFFKDSEETGKNKIINFLKELCINFMNYEAEIIINNDENYNDIFEDYDLNEKQKFFFLKNSDDFPIIENFDDLIQIIVKLLYNFLKNDDNFICFIFEIIDELKTNVGISDNKENSIFLLIKELDLQIKIFESNILDIEKEIRKRNFQMKNNIQKRKLLIEKLEQILKQKENIANNIEKTSLRILDLIIYLIQNMKILTNLSGIKQLLSTFIGPLLLSKNQLIKEKSLYCLSMIINLDKKLSLEYLPLFYHFIEEETKLDIDLNSRIISMKLICDLVLLYDFSNEELKKHLELNNLSMNSQDSNNLLIKILKISMFKSELLLKKIAIEGLCKLICNNRYLNENNLLNQLVFIWINFSLSNTNEMYIIQLMALFLKNFVSYNYENLSLFTNSFAIVLESFLKMNKNQITYNQNYINIIINENFLINMLKIGLYLINNVEKKITIEKNQIFPQENLFLYFVMSFQEYYNKSISGFFIKGISFFNLQNLNEVFDKKVKFCYCIKKLKQNNNGLNHNKFLEKFMQKDICNDRNIENEETIKFYKKTIEEKENIIKKSRELINEWKDFSILEAL